MILDPHPECPIIIGTIPDDCKDCELECVPWKVEIE